MSNETRKAFVPRPFDRPNLQRHAIVCFLYKVKFTQRNLFLLDRLNAPNIYEQMFFHFYDKLMEGAFSLKLLGLLLYKNSYQNHKTLVDTNTLKTQLMYLQTFLNKL
jgi:hypothetical protein